VNFRLLRRRASSGFRNTFVRFTFWGKIDPGLGRLKRTTPPERSPNLGGGIVLRRHRHLGPRFSFTSLHKPSRSLSPVRFEAQYGLKSDVALGPKSADMRHRNALIGRDEPAGCEIVRIVAFANLQFLVPFTPEMSYSMIGLNCGFCGSGLLNGGLGGRLLQPLSFRP
jgi:hypothetical protein